MEKIRVGIIGYGNLGRGAEIAVSNQPDMELVGIFTRRNPNDIKPFGKVNVFSVNDIISFKDKVDVMLLCGGSATDLEKQSVEYIKYFNTVDSFDTHAKTIKYRENLDNEAKMYGHLGGMSIGWDPGIFSLSRMLFGAVLPNGNDYTFWGKGVSQGHSDAIRRIEGVKNAIQYTIPIDKAMSSVRSMENPTFTTREKHKRECFVVAKVGADKDKIEKTIKEMPNYFADYDTTVHFVSDEELKENHSKLSHGGFVMRTGETTKGTKHLLELSLKLDSNPEFTGSVLTAYARAVAKLNKEGKTGVVTVFDVPVKYLSPFSEEELIKKLL